MNGTVLVIGLDGATFDILLPLMQQGDLPNLADLMDRGCWGRLSSTIPPFTATAWSSFITGKNPGQHGIISFRGSRDRFNYDVQGGGFVNARQLTQTLWEVLSAQGKRIGVVNVPLTYPPIPINGYMITGMLTPPGAKNFTYPSQLTEILGDEYVVDLEFALGGGERFEGNLPSKLEMIDQVRRMSKIRARVCTQLLHDGSWDFFMVVFTGTDRIMHFLWNDLVALVHDNIGEAKDAIQYKIKTYFRELDESLGQLIDLIGSEGTVFVLSDHGFGPAPTRRLYLNVWLERIGLLQCRRSQGIRDLEYWRVKLGRNRHLKAILRHLLPQSTQDKVKTITESISAGIIDWISTRAYFVPIYFHVCGIEINLAGERRHGIVQPGVEYEALRSYIIQEAMQLRDPHNGRTIVKIAARREDLYDGPYTETFPDIILVLDPDYIGASSLAGSLLVEHHSPMRPGEHRQDGIFIAAGSPIHSQGELPDLNLLDVPPTILHVMGVPLPHSFDGHVLKQIFDLGHPRHQGTTGRSLSPVSHTSLQDESLYSQEELEQLERRLRGLGYIE